MTDENGFPRAWDWSTEGDEVDGTFAALEEAPTANGWKPLVVLEVAGEPRTVWLFHEALRCKFAQELERRGPDGELRVGEPVMIQRLGDKESANGRTYMDYRVTFPESPRRSPREILGVGTPAPADDDEDVPF